MNSLYTALTLSLIANNKRFVVSSYNSNTTIPAFVYQILQQQCKLKSSQIAVVDLLQVHSTIDLINQMVVSVDDNTDGELYLKNVIIWKNIQHLSTSQHKSLYKLLLQLDEYEMNIARLRCDKLLTVFITIDNQELKIHKPEVFTIVSFLDFDHCQTHKLYVYLKEKFWLSINHNEYHDTQVPPPLRESSYFDYVLGLRKQMPTQIYIAPDIKRYIYSLIVHIRCHRLASISPKTVRVPTMTFDYICDFCKALILFKNIPERYVTPDYVKIATRIIGYWLVDWEYNRMFSLMNRKHKEEEEEEKLTLANVMAKLGEELDYLKRLEIVILNGDWFGSDYFFVNEYLKHAKSKFDGDSPTGYTNRVIEDVLTIVRPPL